MSILTTTPPSRDQVEALVRSILRKHAGDGTGLEASANGKAASRDGAYRPHVVLAGGPGSGSGSGSGGAPEVPLLRDRTPVDGRAAAYVCEGFLCRAPVTDADALAAAL